MSNHKSPRPVVAFRLSREQHAVLKAIAAKEDISPAQLMEEVVVEFLPEQDPSVPGVARAGATPRRGRA